MSRFAPLRGAPFAVGLLAAGLLTMATPLPLAAQVPAAAPGCQGDPGKLWINIAVTGVRNGDGLIAVSVYADDQSRFLAHHGSLFTARFPAHQGTTQACVYLPRPGVYAFASYHDENGNRKLDRGMTGLPVEGFGFSNNPSTFMGIPAFGSVRLAAPKANLATTIKLRYP
jgi:uncharacterized protein (DUF2141 family)